MDGKQYAGYGVWFGVRHQLNCAEKLPGPRQTNNRAEITAALHVLNVVLSWVPLQIARTSSQKAWCTVDGGHPNGQKATKQKKRSRGRTTGSHERPQSRRATASTRNSDAQGKKRECGTKMNWFGHLLPRSGIKVPSEGGNKATAADTRQWGRCGRAVWASTTGSTSHSPGPVVLTGKCQKADAPFCVSQGARAGSQCNQSYVVGLSMQPPTGAAPS